MAAITAAIAAATLAATAAGTATSIVGASKQNAAQQQAIAAQQAAEAQRMQAMELDAKRRQLEVLRNQQRARALGLATATNQGAQLGSGLAGATGQIQGQGGVNSLGIAQNLQLGENIFSANQSLSSARMQMAGAQEISTIGAGISGLGHSIGNVSTQLRDLSGGLNFNRPDPGGGY